MSTIESAPKAAPKSGLASLEASGQAPTPASPFVEGFEQWVKDFNKYESMLVSASSYFFPQSAQLESVIRAMSPRFLSTPSTRRN